ncbi:uncharacterized protein LOC123987879 [Osmia bicornis bicornis]|uniref:uncharacterized protein LOC123987879 n=1 Tax=Osmia bicornis bicornis TaxID=1437191 RepID=UPI001EAEAA9A|nr:uncharacterized protein LOC123987879 [Osmia bicornis bicornis]
MNPQDRLSLVKKVGVCTACLNSGHEVAACKSNFRCLVCEANHHTSLHDTYREDQPSSSKANIITPSTSAAYTVRSQRVILLATARVRLESTEGRTLDVRALLDPGSESSFVSEKVAQSLQLQRKSVRVLLTGYQEKSVGMAKHEVSVELTSCADSDFRITLNALVTRKVTSPTPSHPVEDHPWIHTRELPLADPEFRLARRVDVLLGADVCGYLFLENKVGPPGTPSLVRTPFGWSPLGPVSTSDDPASGVARVQLIRGLDDLRNDLQRFWELEEVPSKSPWSPQDTACEEYFKETHSRDELGRYVVRLPFLKATPENIGVPRRAALQRFLAAERRWEKDSFLQTSYAGFMEEYLRLGHMEPASKYDVANANYLPHHAVWKTTGSGNKRIRVVFDGSYVSGNRPSLNQALASGPRLQSDLWLVLTRWRFPRCEFSTDIVKMFRQIAVHPDDRDWQRILWRDEAGNEVRDFRLTTVTYGTTSAPYLALRVLQQLADDEEQRFPLGAAILRRNSYVDDLLAGADDPAKAEESRQQLIGILMAGGFPLDKWTLNYTSQGEPSERDHKFLQASNDAETLGLTWNAVADTLTVTSAKSDQPSTIRTWTKRLVLSYTARLFDPLGWASPVLIRAKTLLPDLWLSGADWDEPLSVRLEEPWLQFRQDLEEVKTISLPRWVSYRDAMHDHIELHGFCDASERAYAAAVYVRLPSTSTMANVHLLIAKTKLAPIKLCSIPRLELCGALLLARLMVAVRDGILPLRATLYAWTDTSVVLSWVQSHASRWKPFVAHRVAEIQTLLPAVDWRHLRSGDNPADLATRGVTVQALKEDERWWHGPSWLQSPSSDWPSSIRSQDDSL